MFRKLACRQIALLTLIGFAVLERRAKQVPTVSGFFISERHSPSAHEWSYDQQELWARRYKSCALRAQSPINIEQRNVITSGNLRIQFYNYEKRIKFKLQNAHHTIKMDPLGRGYSVPSSLERLGLGRTGGGGSAAGNNTSFHNIMTADEYVEPTAGAKQTSGSPPSARRSPGPALTAAAAEQTQPVRASPSDVEPADDDVEAAATSVGAATLNEIAADDGGDGPSYEGAPTIKLDWLDDGNNEYKLRDIHFHWGERRDNGSEHAIDGRRAAMEMHLVHIKHGLDKSKIGFTSDSVAVIAILIESHRKSNADFNPIVDELTRINMTDEAQEIEFKSINGLLPSNLHSFYTYAGSLTTPPCYQVVNWIVMAERLNMNAKQIEMFRNVYAPPAAAAATAPAAAAHTANGRRKMTSAAAASTSSAHGVAGLADEPPSLPTGQHDNPVSGAEHLSAKLILPNIRSIQVLNNRTIMASFSKWGRLESASGYSSAESIHRRATTGSVNDRSNGYLAHLLFLLLSCDSALAAAILTVALSTSLSLVPLPFWTAGTSTSS